MASAAVGSPSRMREAAGQAGGLSTSTGGGAAAARGGGIGEAPSRRRQHGHSQSLSHSTPSSLSNPASPSAIDRFIKSLLPQSAFPSSIVGAGSASDDPSGSQATTTARLTDNNTTLSRSRASSVSSSSSSLVQPASPATATNGTPGKSKSRAPRSSIGAGKAAHAQRHHHHQGSLSIDSTYSQPKSMPPSDMITRTRSKTGVTPAGNNVRAPSPASFYAGGIGESPAPANRSRQNSSSSLGSTHLTSSMFSHRQSNSSATQQDAHTFKGGKSTPGGSRLNTSSSANTSALASPPSTANPNATSPGNSNTLPSIRGYTTFPDNTLSLSTGLSSTRPRTPLLDPFMRYRQPLPQASPSGITPGVDGAISNEPPRIGMPNLPSTSSSYRNEDPAPSESYVASLAMAPLVSYPTNTPRDDYQQQQQQQQQQPLYIQGGRTPDTLHAAPSSTYSTPAMNMSSPSMQYTASNQTGILNNSHHFTAGPATRSGTLDSSFSQNQAQNRRNNAGLGVGTSGTAGPSRLAPRHRSNSVDSYLQRDIDDEEADDNNHARHTRQQSSGGNTGGFGSFFHLRSSRSRSRKNSLSNTIDTGHSAKLSSRFVHYGQPSPASRPRTPNSASEHRTRQRSSSFGGTATQDAYRSPDGDESLSPTQLRSAGSADTRGRLPRGHTGSRSNSAVGSSSSFGRRRSRGEADHQKRIPNKLISARLPPDIDHREARIPSQPLGYTWVCGSRSAARTPSFYDEFDYSKFPGGKRKRSMSRSTIIPRTYTANNNAMNRNGSRAGIEGGEAGRETDDLAYESEPEFLARERARNAHKEATAPPNTDATVRARIRNRDGVFVNEATQTVQDEATQTTPRYGTPSVEDLYRGNLPSTQQQAGTFYSGALLDPQEEKALRRRSRSLVNLRRDNDGTGTTPGTVTNAKISHPFRDRSSELIRTPRAAPIPMSTEEGLAVPPLFMGESAVIPSPPKKPLALPRQTSGHAHPSPNVRDGTGLRRAPSRASIEAIDDPEKRREALFAALPPPTRRSPTPASAASSLHMFPTGKVLSPNPSATTAVPTAAMETLDLDNRASEDISQQLASIERSGAMSPPVDDYSQFEASRVIIGESDLLSPANAQERFPVVYGQAFSTAHESQEGEILDTSPLLEDNSGLFRDTSRDSGGSRNSLTPLPGHVSQMGQDTSGSGGSGSASRSISNGSARILDLNEESFTNLFYKAPPPSKPLPSLPLGSPAQSPCIGDSRSRGGTTPSPATEQREGSRKEYLGYEERRPTSLTPEDRFPTPDFTVLQSFDLGATGSDAGSNRHSQTEAYTHPFARVSPSHPSAAISGARNADNDWSNVDESLLHNGRQVWPPSNYEDDENETLLQPPPMERNFTTSTARTVDTFYTVTGGLSNASTSALNAPPLHHQESFASARSHITASSAARTPQAEIAQPSTFLQDRGRFIDDDHSDDERERDIMATIRRTDLSPIFVPRAGLPAQFLQQHARDNTASPALSSRPGTARGSEEEVPTSNRESFIDFEPVVPVRPRAASDTRSFIDDDSDDEEGPRTSESAVAPALSMNAKLNRPSVIVEHLDEEEERDVSSDGLSPLGPTTPLTPLYPLSSTTSASHYSLTPSDIIDNYRSRESSNDPSRNSQGQFSLGLPLTPKGGDRSSGGSHSHSISNVSILSSLSKLEDFPEPPPSVTPAYEKDQATAMEGMHHQPSRSTLGNGEQSTGLLRPRVSSLPTGPHNQSRATIDTQATQNTSIYTFTSSADDGEQRAEQEDSQQMDRQDSSSSQRRHALFEFPMRRSGSKRSTADSFIDTTTSPDRGTFDSQPFDGHHALSSSSTSPALSTPVTGAGTSGLLEKQQNSSSSSSSPHSQHFRLSGIFARRPKHERTFSDPSLSNIQRASFASARRDSGGFENPEEKRQSWRGF